MAVIALPVNFVDQYIVESCAGDRLGLTGGRIGDPELHPRIMVESEGDFLAVVRPVWPLDRSPLRQRDPPRRAPSSG